MNLHREPLDDAIDRVAVALTAVPGEQRFVFTSPPQVRLSFPLRASLQLAGAAVLMMLVLMQWNRGSAPGAVLPAASLQPFGTVAAIAMERPQLAQMVSQAEPRGGAGASRGRRAAAPVLLTLSPFPPSPFELDQLPGPPSLQINAIALGDIAVASLEPGR